MWFSTKQTQIQKKSYPLFEQSSYNYIDSIALLSLLRLCSMPMYRVCQHIPSLIHVAYKLNLSVFKRALVLGTTAVGWVAKILWEVPNGRGGQQSHNHVSIGYSKCVCGTDSSINCVKLALALSMVGLEYQQLGNMPKRLNNVMGIFFQFETSI